MRLFSYWQQVAIACLSIFLSMVGIKSANARPVPAADTSATPAPADSSAIAQAPVCTYEWQELETYARIATQNDSLRVRATPGGRIVGAVPKGWAVVVVAVDATGEWTKITSHFGDVDADSPASVVFGSAPAFSSGWVASRYLEELGEFCEKPMLGAAAVQFTTGTNAQPYTVAQDWLQLGDRIAQTPRQS